MIGPDFEAHCARGFLMSATNTKTAVHNALACLPDRDTIRSRIAENLQERQLLRQLLRLVDQHEKTTTARKGGRPC